MKRAIFAATLFLLMTTYVFSQDTTSTVTPKHTIESDFTSYLGFLVNKEFAKSMEYMVPEFFDIFPKEQMIQVMEQTFNDPNMEFELKDPKILGVGDIAEIEGKFYAKLRYGNKMNMKILGEEEESEEDKEMRIKFTKLSFEQTFGPENVSYNSESDSYQIYSEKDVVAISENGISDWKFLVVEEKQKFILEKLVPEQVLDME